MSHPSVSLFIFALAVFTIRPSFAQAQFLESDLQTLSTKELAEEARAQGDPARGAIVFFQKQMACSKCHPMGNQVNPQLGPDLTSLGAEYTDEQLVESVLYPSKRIRKGFESITLRTVDEVVISGLLVESTSAHVLVRDLSQDGLLRSIPTSDIEDLKQNQLSAMPAGQMNQLNSRQQFFDLIRYLMEIRNGGVERAKALQPSDALLGNIIPEYENRLNHVALIQNWNSKSLKRGEAIYQRVCANCHGTLDQPGSLPTSLRFAEGKFKNGSDPLSMYRTLTFGFGLMVPQTWMVPSQKYDVIHYIRETYLKPHNASQYAKIDKSYLDGLPNGDSLGPEPSKIETWSAMDYGPNLAHTFEVPGEQHNFAYKGIAMRLDPGSGGVSRGKHWMLFDTDTLRMAAGWSQPSNESNGTQNKDSHPSGSQFIDWQGIQFDGKHGIHPRIVGLQSFSNSTGPGWANPANSEFEDNQRVQGRDGKRYGPLPRQWGRYKGMYHYGQRTVLSYSIGSTDILELPHLSEREKPFASTYHLRSFHIGPRDRPLHLHVADTSRANDTKIRQLTDGNPSSVVVGPTSEPKVQADANLLVAGFAPSNLPFQWDLKDSQLILRIPSGGEPLSFTVWIPADVASLDSPLQDPSSKGMVDGNRYGPIIEQPAIDLIEMTRGGPARWPQLLTTQTDRGNDDGPFAVDVLKAPEQNPWLAQTRFTGLDFFSDGRIAICTWDGDVWLVTPKNSNNSEELQWQRIASGLFQPLGLKIVRSKIHLTCRDQLVVLHDYNHDNETDFYECLNNDHQVTEHFHEFAMGLQTDSDGNFYYAKSGCHGKAAVVPHHGTLLRVSPDGRKTDILANGFRAANGVCLNPDGSFVVTDQEGFWNPKNRINWVTLRPDGKPNFYGNMLGYHDIADSSDEAMEPPLCWITNEFDRSPAELLWVESESWGPLNRSLLNLSYGYGKVFLVPHESVRGKMQGGMIELPIPSFPTGVMRGRFHATDGHLYLCGMFAWAGNATHPGGFYRIRATGKPIVLPVQLNASRSQLKLTFPEALDPKRLESKNVEIKTWSLKRTANYGSKHFNERNLPVESVALSEDKKTLILEVPDLRPTWGMEIKYTLRTLRGMQVQGTVHNTIHEIAE